MPFFSIIIPIYNSERTISHTIESVINQSFPDWELILVDDCSSDASPLICNQFSNKDHRIRCYHTQANTGSAKLPREIGIDYAIGQYVVFIDSDDEINNRYLLDLYAEIESNTADVVIPRAIIRNMDDSSFSILPDTTIDVSKVVNGKEACLMTLPYWHICCGGMSFRRELYDGIKGKNPNHYMNSDEFTSRLLLFSAKKIAFSRAEYTYWQHSSSITHKVSIDLYDILTVDLQLLEFVKTNYEKNVVNEVGSKMLSDLIRLQKLFINNKRQFSNNDKKLISCKMKEGFRGMKSYDINFSDWKSKLFSINMMVLKCLCFLNH